LEEGRGEGVVAAAMVVGGGANSNNGGVEDSLTEVDVF